MTRRTRFYYVLSIIFVFLCSPVFSQTSPRIAIDWGIETVPVTLSTPQLLPESGFLRNSYQEIPKNVQFARYNINYFLRKNTGISLELFIPAEPGVMTKSSLLPYSILYNKKWYDYNKHYSLKVTPQINMARLMLSRYTDKNRRGFIMLGVGYASISVNTQTSQYLVDFNGNTTTYYNESNTSNISGFNFIYGGGLNMDIGSFSFKLSMKVMTRIHGNFNLNCFNSFRLFGPFNNDDICPTQGSVGLGGGFAGSLSMGINF